METPITCALCNLLGSKDGYFLPITDEAKLNHARIHFVQSKTLDNEITEDEIFRRCFSTKQPKAEHPTLSPRKCNQSLLDLCKSFLKHGPYDTSTICNMCGNKISVKGDTRSMVQHACAHLELKLFKCLHCGRLSSRKWDIRCHVRQAHCVSKPTIEDFENKTVENFEYISERIKRCFSSSYPRASGLEREFISKCQEKGKRSVVHLCRSIYNLRSKPSSLECNLCGSRISVHGFQAKSMYAHAAAHLEVKLFTCSHCDQSMSSKAAMLKHLRNRHQINDGNDDDFDDRSDEFHSEYLSMIERCFSADRVKRELPPSNVKDTIKAERSIRWRAWSKLTLERHLFLNRWIKNRVDSDGKMKCSLCSKRLTVMFSSHAQSEVVFAHAEMHLQIPLYRCKLCRSSFSTQKGIGWHLKSKHALGMEKNYECIGDEFHAEILGMLNRCYAQE